MVQRNYLLIKEDVQNIVSYEMERILEDQALLIWLLKRVGDEYNAI